MGDIQTWFETFEHLAKVSQARKLVAIKSLCRFGHVVGYLPFDVGRVFRVPIAKDMLAERVLDEALVLSMIDREPNERNRLILRLLYASGARVSELAGLRWRDVQARGDTGQLTLFGKGRRTRTVLLSMKTWQVLVPNRAAPDEPVFAGRYGRALSASAVWRIVKAAGRRVGADRVSPHWLRHAHASHALDRGAKMHVLQATLGHASVATTGRYTHARPLDGSGLHLAI